MPNSDYLLGSVWLKGEKSGRIENGKRIEKILIFLIFVWLEVENERMEKVSLYKFMHIPLIKNDAQLKKKKKSDKQPKKKINHLNLF